jgi:hypothetical protein
LAPDQGAPAKCLTKIETSRNILKSVKLILTCGLTAAHGKR